MAGDDAWNNWPITLRKCIVEYIGTCLLVFMGSLSFTFPSSSGALGPAFAHGFTLAFCILSLGHISGGHFNPAVSLGCTISGALHPILLPFYVVSQLVGGIVGGFLVFISVNLTTYCQIGGGTNTITDSHSAGLNAFFLECVLTYCLVQTVLGAAVDREGKNVLAGLAIGITLVAAICAGGDKSGASLNPARTLGPAITYSVISSIYHPGNTTEAKCQTMSSVWDEEWYADLLGPTVGALVAAATYNFFGQSAASEKRERKKIMKTKQKEHKP